MNPQVGHHAIFGCLDRGSRQLIVGRLQPLAYLEDLALYFPQRLRDLVLAVILQFDERSLRFVDDLLGARYLRDNLTPPSLDVGHFPLQAQKPRAPLESLVDEHGDRIRFLADDFDALRGRALLRRQALDLFFNLRPSVPIDRRLRLEDLPTCFENALLARKNGRE